MEEKKSEGSFVMDDLFVDICKRRNQDSLKDPLVVKFFSFLEVMW